MEVMIIILLTILDTALILDLIVSIKYTILVYHREKRKRKHDLPIWEEAEEIIEPEEVRLDD